MEHIKQLEAASSTEARIVYLKSLPKAVLAKASKDIYLEFERIATFSLPNVAEWYFVDAQMKVGISSNAQFDFSDHERARTLNEYHSLVLNEIERRLREFY